MRPLPLIVLSASLWITPALSATNRVLDPAGTPVREPAGASSWSDARPRTGRESGAQISRSSVGDGFTIGTTGNVTGRGPLRISGAPLTNATIDSISFGDQEDSHPADPSIYMLGMADRYYLSDGSNWQSGAGSGYATRAAFDHSEVVGTTIRYFFRPAAGHIVYRQTDFNFGQHSSQGQLDCANPLLLEAAVGSNVAVLRGVATITSNEATYYDSFNYFSAAVGTQVPFRIVYTRIGGPWTPDAFDSEVHYAKAGRVWFTLPVPASPLVDLTISGPDQVAGVSGFRYRAIAHSENGVLTDVSEDASWEVEPAALATVDKGLVSTRPLSTPEATLFLHAGFTDGGTTRTADRSIRYLPGPADENGTDWPMYQANARHTGYRAVALDPAGFALKWQRVLPTAFGLNPVTASGGRVFCSVITYFGQDDALRALDARTGETLWTVTYPGVFSINPPSVGLGKVFVQTGNHASDTWLRALDPATGATIFQTPHGAQWERYFAPTIYGEDVYVDGGSYGGMYAFDGNAGTMSWYSGLPQYDQWTPAVDDQFAYAYVGDYSPGLYVIRRSDGVLDHFVPDIDFEWNGWSMNLAPVLGGASDVLAIHDGRLINFDLAGEAIRWQVESEFGGQPSVEGGAIYAIDGGRLSVRDEIAGGELWNWTPPGSGLSSNIILTKTHVLVASDDQVFAVDRATHASVWSHPVGGELALADGMLFVSSPTSGLLTAIEVASPAAPVANAGADVTVECAADGGKGTAVKLDGSGSTGDGLTYAWSAPNIAFDDPASATPTGHFPLGVTEVTLVVSSQGHTATDVMEVEVVDTTAPSVVVTTDAPVLWPPSHQLVPVHFVVQSSDACDAQPTVRLLSVTSDEPDANLEIGDLVSDIQGAAAGTTDFDVLLRAERAGAGAGRTYTVCFEATDETGNHSQGCAEVLVPHDQKGGGRLAASKATLFGSASMSAQALDAAFLRVVRTRAVPLVRDASAVDFSDVDGDHVADATIGLRADGSGSSGPAYAVWRTADGVCATLLDRNEVTGVGSETIDFAAGVLRNPGVGSAVIRYTLPAPGPVRIAIWDVTGRMVGRPVDRVESVGTHTFTFDPRGRGTQLYFYRVEWQGATRTGRFTILE